MILVAHGRPDPADPSLRVAIRVLRIKSGRQVLSAFLILFIVAAICESQNLKGVRAD